MAETWRHAGFEDAVTHQINPSAAPNARTLPYLVSIFATPAASAVSVPVPAMAVN